ncbi:MAG: hypothetical protein KC492_15125 [Myxococcales bacterium]|nr:hypothetical protein [Myxococcales bacterium]
MSESLGPIGRSDNVDIISAMRIDVLVLDGVFDLGLAALLDTLKTANELAPNVPGPRVRFDVRTLGCAETCIPRLASGCLSLP